MSDCKTLEGHEIIAGECYETRDGRKAFIGHIYKHQREYPLVGIICADYKAKLWTRKGNLLTSRINDSDIMRPWKGEKDHFVGITNIVQDEQTLLQYVREQYAFAPGSECDKVITVISKYLEARDAD